MALTSDDLLLSATALGAALDERRVSAVELLDLHIGRIERQNAPLNALVTFDFDRARHDALASDKRREADQALGPFDGLPITIKDSISTAAIRTTSGAPFLADFVPPADAAAVARLRAAGCVIMAKSNLPTMAGDVQTNNPVFGRTNNPWDLERTPGGSSGGSAAAIAVGMSALELGSDIAGSVRNPAHYCGIYAHKPTFDLVPTTGHIPPPPGIISPADMGTLGPMARSADDLVRAIEILATPLPGEAPSWRAAMQLPRHASSRGQRIALWSDDPLMPVDADTRDMMERVGDALQSVGCIVDRTARPAFDLLTVIDAYLSLVMPLFGAGLPDEAIDALVAETAGASPEARKYVAYVAAGRSQSLAGHMAAKEVQARAITAWATFFESYDAVICPVMPTAAFAHDERGSGFSRTFSLNGSDHPYWDQCLWCGVLANFAYLPATSRPAGFSPTGLPMGIQIVGPAMGDLGTISLAGWMDDVLGGFVPPPIAKE